MPTDAAVAQMLRKLVRTAQNYFPGLAEAKNEFYHLARKHLGFVHERDFSAVALLPRGGDDLFVDIGANRARASCPSGTIARTRASSASSRTR